MLRIATIATLIAFSLALSACSGKTYGGLSTELTIRSDDPSTHKVYAILATAWDAHGQEALLLPENRSKLEQLARSTTSRMPAELVLSRDYRYVLVFESLDDSGEETAEVLDYRGPRRVRGKVDEYVYTP